MGTGGEQAEKPGDEVLNMEAEQTSGTAGDQAARAARPEREATLKDYIRIFSYATKWDLPIMVAAAVASIGAGVVSISLGMLMLSRLPWTIWLIWALDHAVDECRLREACWELHGLLHPWYHYNPGKNCDGVIR